MDLAALVCRYAERFAALGGDEHQVGSPLGAWLVIALAAPTAEGALRKEIVDALGTDVDRTAAACGTAEAPERRGRCGPRGVVDTRPGGPWGTQLTHALHSRSELGHAASIVATERAGLVAVHTAQADARLSVTSVIAAPDVPRADVRTVAHQVAVARARNGIGSSVSLFDLPLGDGPLWTVTEHQAVAAGQHVEAILPAWHVESEHDLLTVPALAFGAAGDALKRRAQVVGPVEAAQSAVAKYTQHGFEAAAVTALGIFASGRMAPPPGPYRTATVRFAHPYAVVATTTRGQDDDLWSGLPVFVAWVTRPDDSS